MLSFITEKLHIKSGRLAWVMAVYFGTIMNLSLWRYVWDNLEVDSLMMGIFGVVLFLGINLLLYIIFNLIIYPYIAKPLLVFLLLSASAINYLTYTFGVYIDSDMVRNAFQTNTREALDLVTFKAFIWVFVLGIIPSVVLVFSKIVYKPFWKELRYRLLVITFSLLCVIFMLGATYKEVAAFGRNNSQMRRLINPSNYIYSTIKYFYKEHQAKKPFVKLDENPKIVSYGDNIKTVLVIVVGETARSANFSLGGYKRETNPLLGRQDVAYFKNTTSCGTATAASVPCMFSNLGREDFNVQDAPYMENLIDVLHNAGYDVWWRENDDGCKGVCKRVNTEYMVRQNNPEYCNGKYCKDGVLLEGLREYLKNIKKDTVIVMHTMGSHGPTYYLRYPDEFKKFKPTCDTAEIQDCTREQIINTYDNTILYTDYVVSSMIDILKEFPQYEAGLLYVSDHGESLGENNIYLHGLPYKIAPQEQTHVPMLVWLSKTMQKYDYIDYKCLKQAAENGKYSHDNLFHSVTGLLEVKTTAYDERYDIFDKCRTKPLPH